MRHHASIAVLLIVAAGLLSTACGDFETGVPVGAVLSISPQEDALPANGNAVTRVYVSIPADADTSMVRLTVDRGELLQAIADSTGQQTVVVDAETGEARVWYRAGIEPGTAVITGVIAGVRNYARIELTQVTPTNLRLVANRYVAAPDSTVSVMAYTGIDTVGTPSTTPVWFTASIAGSGEPYGIMVPRTETDADGRAVVALQGDGRAATVVVTATLAGAQGELSDQITVVFE